MKSVAQRYARALADVALAHNIAAKAGEELRAFAALAEESAELRNFLASPAIPRAKKEELVRSVAARMKLSDAVRNLLLVVVDNRRTGELEAIARAYHEELLARLGIADVYVTSAQELDEGQRRELTGALERLTGKKVAAQYWVDPELIGGAVVRIGSTIYDGSVRQQLHRLRAQLAAE